MNLQIINSQQGLPEYVLLPIRVYHELKIEIEAKLKEEESDYVPFILEDYIKNPATLMRIKACITQEELAEKMDVTQAYISKIERQKKVTSKTLQKINKALLAFKDEKTV
jgi:DNA-binding XRE family transcriptional regulator